MYAALWNATNAWTSRSAITGKIRGIDHVYIVAIYVKEIIEFSQNYCKRLFFFLINHQQGI